jgi:3-keto-5-aminohexanoate cleavage enzyme
MMDLIIAVGINEHVGKDVNPHVPITPKEIAEDAKECVDAGATIIHLHARHTPATAARSLGPSATSLLRADESEAYMVIWDAMEAAGVDVPVYMGVGSGYSQLLAAKAQGATAEDDPVGYRCVEATAARPGNRLEIAPVIAGSVDWYNFGPGALHWQPRPLHRTIEDAEYELQVARRLDLWVSHDIWEPGNVRLVNELWRRGLYDRPFLLKFFMAEYSSFGMPPEPRYLDTFVSMISPDADTEWLVLPYGSSDRGARAIWSHAICSGGHVRVGIGDNPGGEGDRFPATNAERVEQVVRMAAELGREVASVDAVRARFAPLKQQ